MVPQRRADVADRPAFRDVGFEALQPRIRGGELPSLFDMTGQQIPVEHGHPEGGQFHAYVFPVMSHAPVAVVLTAIANLLRPWFTPNTSSCLRPNSMKGPLA